MERYSIDRDLLKHVGSSPVMRSDPNGDWCVYGVAAVWGKLAQEAGKELARVRTTNADLLAACKSAMETLAQVQVSGLRPKQIRETQREWEALRDAIAKAEGK